MDTLIQQIEDCKKEMSQFDAAQPDSAEVFRIRFLGTKGQIKALMGELKNVSPEQRKGHITQHSACLVRQHAPCKAGPGQQGCADECSLQGHGDGLQVRL